MATLKDVAKLAHVDVSTVSRALNNTSYVHPDTKQRIFDAVKQLSYHPNVLAQGLRQGKRHTIGLIVPRLMPSIFGNISQGVETAALKYNYGTLICNTGDNPATEQEILTRLRDGFVDGIIIAGTGANNRIVKDIHASGIPVIQVIRQPIASLSSVTADYRTIGYNAVQYLYRKGCRTIGIIESANTSVPYLERYEGYHKAMNELDLREVILRNDVSQNNIHYGYDCMISSLMNHDACDGILAASDAQGIGVFRALKERHIRVPEDIKVLSLTGYQMGEMLETSLTSMELPSTEIGVKSFLMLLEAINAKNAEAKGAPKYVPQHLSFPAELVERESTAS
jgi:LacI family transcriptional regulator